MSVAIEPPALPSSGTTHDEVVDEARVMHDDEHDAASHAEAPAPRPVDRSGPAALVGPTPGPPRVVAVAQPAAAHPHLDDEPSGPEQLALPMPEIDVSTGSWATPRQRRVFVNQSLHMTEVDWIGFDMDYTLAIYDQPQMDELQIRCTLPRLVARGYPAFLEGLSYDITFPIRGLMIDKKHGHVLKMDRYKVVHKAWHGMRQLDRDEIRALYQQRKIRLTAARYHWIDTLYALSEVTMYAAITEALEQAGHEVDHARLFQDIRESIDEAHRDGTVLEAVAADFGRFVRRDPELAQTLHKWRSAGKKLFLLTNSRWSYTDRMMTYLLHGAMPEYPTWRQYFDVIVAAAAKPAFFQERRPLLERDEDTLRPADGPLERDRVYEGGNLHDFEHLLGVTGDRVLYVGDHIYGDILRSKKESSWRTAMIIQEMTAEVNAHTESQRDIDVAQELEARRQRSEDELRFLQQRLKELTRRIEGGDARSEGLVAPQVLEAERVRLKRGVDRVRAVLRALDAELVAIEDRIDRRFHPYWGSLLKEANETSSFGNQVEEYACLYTSRVSNFLAYSPLQHFRSPRDRMAHEV